MKYDVTRPTATNRSDLAAADRSTTMHPAAMKDRMPTDMGRGAGMDHKNGAHVHGLMNDGLGDGPGSTSGKIQPPNGWPRPGAL